MSDDSSAHDLPPDDLLQVWEHLAPDERAALLRTWQLAGTAAPEGAPPTEEAVERLLAALDAAERPAAPDRAAIRPPSFHSARRATFRRWPLAAGIALAALLFGTYGLTQQDRAPVAGMAAPTASQFMLLLHGDVPDAVHDEVVAEYAAWARTLTRDGRYVGGDELADTGRYLTYENEAVAVRALEPAPDAVSGYFIISADDEDEALRIAAACPHLRRGGSVELRRLVHP